MDNDQKFWLSIWALVLIGFLGMCFCITTTSLYADYKISCAIKDGANPIEAKYALRGTSVSEDAWAWMSKAKTEQPCKP